VVLQGPVLLDAPTELLPLVGYGKNSYSHDAASSEFEFSSFGDDLAGGELSFPTGLLQRQMSNSATAGNLSNSNDFRMGASNSSNNLAGMAGMNATAAAASSSAMAGPAAAAAAGHGAQSGIFLDDYNSSGPLSTPAALEGRVLKVGGEAAAGSSSSSINSSSSAALMAAGVVAGSSRPQQRRRGSQHRGLSPVAGGDGEYDRAGTSLIMP
jgi:hypothetical protein